jgi:hypothetical protein
VSLTKWATIDKRWDILPVEVGNYVHQRSGEWVKEPIEYGEESLKGRLVRQIVEVRKGDLSGLDWTKYFS